MASQAGSAYIPIRPDFRGFHKTIRRELSSMTPQLKGVGQEWGRALGEGIRRGIGQEDVFRPFRDQEERQRRRAPKDGADTAGAFARGFKQRLEAAFKSLPDAKVDADSSPADRKIAELRARMEELSKKTIGVDLDAGQALAEIAAIKVELDSLGRNESVQVRVDAAAASAELAAVQAEVDNLDQSDPTVHVHADVSGALSGIGILAASVGALASIPVGAALGAGILSLIGPLGAAGAGFGGLAAVAIPAVTHIKAALQAQKQAQQQAGAAAGQAQARAIAQAGAQQQLASTIRNAAYAHQQALEQVRQAEQQLTQAQQSAIQAQRDLNTARREAARQLQDSSNNVEDAKLSERQATVDLTDAQAAYNKVAAGPAATKDQVARAKLVLDQARQSLKERHLAVQRAIADDKAAQTAGVNGSDAVRTARDRLTASNQRITESERALAKARTDVARTDRNSADQVAAARRAVAQASLQGAGANAKLAASMAALTPAERKLMGDWKGLTAAFSGWAKALEPDVLPLFGRGLNLIKSALPGLTPIVRGAATAVGGLLTDVGNAAKSQFWTQFRNNLTGLVPTAITGLGKSTGNVVTGLAGIVDAFLPYAPALLGWIERITGQFATWGKGLGTSNGFSDFMAYVREVGPQVWQTVIEISRAVRNIVTSLASFGPTALLGIRGLATLIAGMSPGQIQGIAIAFLAVRAAIVANNVANGVANGVSGFSAALKSGGKEGPLFARGAVLAGKGIRNVASAAWSGVTALGRLTVSMTAAAARGTASAFSSAASAIGGVARSAWRGVTALGALAVSYGRAAAAAALSAARTVAMTVAQTAVKIATLAWTAIQWLLNAALSANPIALIVIAIAALVAGVIYAYTHFTWFRNIVQAAWKGIQVASQWAWNNVLKPVFSAVGWYIGNVVVPAYRLLWSVVKAVWKGIQVAAEWAWNNVLKPIFNLIKWYVVNVVVPYFKLLWTVVKTVWNSVGSVIKAVWNATVKPTFNTLKSAVGTVAGAFRTAVDAIKTVWDKLKDVAKKPVSFVVNTVFNKGIVSVWNAVAKLVPGVGKLSPIQGFATGGIYPGYTPGRDVGLAAVSGGEAIMRPEFTRAVGKDFINTSNAAARTGGVSGVARYLAGVGDPGGVSFAGNFFLGGVIGKFKDAAKGFFAGGLKQAAEKVFNPLLALSDRTLGGGGQFGKLVAGIPHALISKIMGAFGPMEAKLGGGSAGAVRAIRKMIGTPYSWGGGGPHGPSRGFGRGANTVGFDCSSLMQYGLYQAFHKAAPRTTYTQRPWLRRITNPVPGAIGQPHAGHTYMYSGNGRIIEAPFTGSHVREVPMRSTPFWGLPPWKFDQGGWLEPGLSLVANATGKPEPVLPPGGIEALIDGRSGGGSVEYHAHFDGMTKAAYSQQVRAGIQAEMVLAGQRDRTGRRR